MTRAGLLLAVLLALPVADPQPILSGVVTHVSDGDTIRMGEVRMRLHGIDAPETAQSCHLDAKEYRCGVEATRFLEKLAQSQRVACVVLDTDRYGRLVGRCRLTSGMDLSRAMVSAGWAVAYVKYSTEYLPEEARARAARLGIWRGAFQDPESWRKEH